MHREILTQEQDRLLSLVKKFSKNFGLVGGTAIALYIGHRESIDFDLFSNEPFENQKIRRKIVDFGTYPRVIRDEIGQYTFFIGNVQMTFFEYPYPIDFSRPFEDIVRIPNLLTLAAMKIFALGRRAKWKDYVDLYFILKDFHSFEEISQKAKELFGEEFNERIAREQLGYFDDINYSEEIAFLPGFETDQETIKFALLEWSLAR
jgi:hypothetical protein